MSQSDDFDRLIETSLKSFDASISLTVSTIAFLNLAITLRPRVGKVLNWEAIDDANRDLVNQFLGCRESDMHKPAYGFIALAYGAFEELSLAVLEKTVIWISACKPYRELDQQLVLENIFRTGRLLTMVKNSRSDISISHCELGANLSLCIDGAIDYRLNADAFRFDAGTLDIDNLDRLANRVGVKLDWDNLGRSKNLEKFYGMTGVRKISKMACSDWDKFVFDRNIVAHTGGEELSIDLSELERRITFLGIFGGLFVDILRSGLFQKYG